MPRHITASGDQTISGNLTVSGDLFADNVVGADTYQTLSNKRIIARVVNVTPNETPTINTDNGDLFKITSLASAITNISTNLSGSPSDGDVIMFRIKDDGSARNITWGTSFQAMGADLPTTTVISKTLHVMFIWDSLESKWGCISAAQQA